ncbi:MAG TPA: prephenate dehydrogenase [Flavisolibacter sp.]|nr:prephenate dehydrogenase [Flavisolibacter sp.]
MRTAIIGMGLIGGSMALALREKGIASSIIGVELVEDHRQKALERGLADRMATLEEAVDSAELIILAMPVHAILRMLPAVLDRVSTQVVMDVGSTKQNILSAIENHRSRGRFVATHPMWGTEFSGPDAAVRGAFVNKAAVICNREGSGADAVALVEMLYKKLGMHIVNMDSAAHDVHVAYVSHISHITSFALANTVLEKEQEEDAIFELASGGFESTVRLAKSNPLTWASIFVQNRENVLDVLNEHIGQLHKFRDCLEKEDVPQLEALMVNANRIKRILK